MLSSKRRIVIIVGITVALTVIGLLFYRLTDVAQLVVSSEGGANIKLATIKGGEFKKVGTGSATFSTRVAGTYFVQAEKDGRTTQASVVLTKRKTVEISLALNQLTDSSKIADGSLAFPHLEGGFAFGVNPNTKLLAAVPLKNPDSYTPFFFFGVSFVTKVSWLNKDNFLYRSEGGLGSVNKGSAQLLDPIGEEIFVDFTRAEGSRPFVLLTNRALYTQSSSLSSSRKLLTPINSSTSPRLFCDDTYIYLVQPEFIYYGDEGTIPDIVKTQITTYDYGGNLVNNQSVDIFENILRLVRRDNGDLVALTENGVYTIGSGGQVHQIPFHFQNTKDLVLVNDKIYILSTDGLWRVAMDNPGVFYLLTPFPSRQDYLEDSLIISPNKQELYFGTRSSSSTQNGSLIEVDL